MEYTQGTWERQMMELRNRHTSYELAISHPDGRKFLVCFSDSKARAQLWKIVSKRAEKLVALAGTDLFTFAKRAADGATLGEWTIAWTGRTKFEIVAGQLDTLPSLPA